MGIKEKLFGGGGHDRDEQFFPQGDGNSAPGQGAPGIEPDTGPPYYPERLRGEKSEGEMTAEEREQRGIIDESRHTGSLGRR